MHVIRRLGMLSVILLMGGWTSCSPRPHSQPPLPVPTPITKPIFDASRAFQYLQEQVALGPRAPGTKGHTKCQEYLFAKLKATAHKVIKQEFRLRTSFGGPYDFANLLGLYGPETGGPTLMLCAHWDTRPVADEDPDPAHRQTPLLGANDGASGVAVLLELTNAFADTPPPIPLIIAFWDAEDSGKSSAPPPYHGFLLGSDYFVKHMPDEARPDEVILLDMVGGDSKHNPRVGTRMNIAGNDEFDLPIETHSIQAAPALVDEVYSAAERLGHKAFQRRRGYTVIDDHLPFIRAGIPAIDLVEFDYPEWHTIDDIPEHCSIDALKQVGETLMEVIYSDHD
ncbi:MAG: M28 family peptidase [Candidatus Zipacnadales bacterium]